MEKDLLDRLRFIKSKEFKSLPKDKRDNLIKEFNELNEKFLNS